MIEMIKQIVNIVCLILISGSLTASYVYIFYTCFIACFIKRNKGSNK